MFNPLEYKHDIASMPLRWLRESLTKPLGSDVPQAMIFGLFGVTTAAINLMPGVTLIHAGFRGEPYFSHIRHVKSALGIPMPMFNYITPWSKAEMIGARIGGRIHAQTMYNMGRGLKASTRALTKGAGYKIGARVGGRLIPGVGWALLAYDVYDIAANRSLWGFDLS